MMTGKIPNVLDKYLEGYAVMINPDEYFGNNYPEPANDLNEKFNFDEGFVYYSSIQQYMDYPPLDNWIEVIELSTTGKPINDDTWIGQYALNIKNTRPPKVSLICKTNSSNKNIVLDYIKRNLPDLKFDKDSIPSQCGLGNYDYDFATKETIENVKLQMEYFILNAETRDGMSFPEYIMENYETIKHKNDTKKFKELMETKDLAQYEILFNREFVKLKAECERRGLLDYDKLYKLGVWDFEIDNIVCPLCGKQMYLDEFFEDISQMAGREVIDNTQKAVVLMHVRALRPGEFNHRPYNLGWGHNYCNLIQGDKDIDKTIEVLKDIIKNYDERN